MDIKVIATTKPGDISSKEELDIFGGRSAGVCYMSGSFEDLCAEDIEKTKRRVSQTKNNGHHSVFDHSAISLYLHEVPKIIAMLINNEKQYTTSEKSGRYTRLQMSPKEETVYNKWVDIFKNKIRKLYASDYPSFFSESKIEKLAQENARYLTSVFTPTCLIYTTTYRQLNYLISFIEKQTKKENKTKFEEKLNPYLIEFLNQLKALPYYDEGLTRNEKCRRLSLFEEHKIEEYFGDVYATTYNGTFAELAQAQRHRTISYSMRVLEGQYYIPQIIRDSESFTELWLSDLKELEDNYPNATLLEISEMGTLDNFILKMKERKCTFAQLEINNVTNETLKKYVSALSVKNHPRARELEAYTKGSRCTFPDYTCPSPCGFPLGVNETRKI